MMKPPIFQNFISWYDWKYQHEITLRDQLLEVLPYEIISSPNQDLKDLRDIGELTEGKWSAFTDYDKNGRYFFELESDALAFKLRWM